MKVRMLRLAASEQDVIRAVAEQLCGALLERRVLVLQVLPKTEKQAKPARKRSPLHATR
jgi:hypothetical protein